MKVLKDILTAWYAFVIFLTLQFSYSLVETCRHYYVDGYWSEHTTDHFTALVWSTTLILLWRHGFYAQWYTWLRINKRKNAEAAKQRRRNDIPMRKWENDDD